MFHVADIIESKAFVGIEYYINQALTENLQNIDNMNKTGTFGVLNADLWLRV